MFWGLCRLALFYHEACLLIKINDASSRVLPGQSALNKRNEFRSTWQSPEEFLRLLAGLVLGFYIPEGKCCEIRKRDPLLTGWGLNQICSTRRLSNLDMTRDYTPFGETLVASGNDDNSYQFSQKELDSDIGLYYTP